LHKNGLETTIKKLTNNTKIMISSSELRQKYLDFFKSKDHSVLSGSSIVPENDPTMLFIGAGMQPLIPYLGGECHPAGKRIVNVQKCIRTIDIDEVGDDTHLTFFEMFGNWSLGDYFKEDSIKYSYEFLTSKEYLDIDINKLAFTCYQGNAKYNVPKDDTSYNAWVSLGISKDRIAYLGDEDNWWPKMGMDGLCGPDTEIFYWVGEEDAPAKFDPKDERWMEIWNNVFMQYKMKDNNLSELDNKNVDTGMGLERTLITLNGYSDVYETDLFTDAILKLEELSSSKYIEHKSSMRIILDHIRASVVMISDGVRPSNVEQGYILRRILRRAIRQGMKIGINSVFTAEIAKVFINNLSSFYTELEKNKEEILKVFTAEEEQFSKTLDKGMKEFDKILNGFKIAFERTGQKITNIAGGKAFKLYDTYGFPIEMTKDLAKENGLTVDEEGFHAAYEKHRELSRKGSEQKFAGGLADHSEESKKLHSATHLMLKALIQVLGDHVHQRGSNITTERLRFDFSHPEKMTDEEKKKVEDIVNEQIKKDLSIYYTEMTIDEAMEKKAVGIFIDKYKNDLGGKVKVYSIGDFSMEVCGGPHTDKTGDLGAFKIIKEESSSSGVRRIKAVIGDKAKEKLNIL